MPMNFKSIRMGGRVKKNITPIPSPVANFTASTTSGSFPLTVTFTDTSTGRVSSRLWDFKNDGTATSTSQNPSYTYTTAGTYTVKLTVSNASGSDTMTKTSYITVTVAPPAADFTASPTSGIYPLSVSFTDTSTGTPTSWLWDFKNDGTATSTSQNPNYTYTTAGTYAVKLTATNSGGSNTVTKTSLVSVTAPPAPDFTVGATGSDFTTLEAALASASVTNGKSILVKNGTYTVTSAITVSKEVKIYGESRSGVIFTTVAASAPVNVFVVRANNVLMSDFTVKHLKTSNTSVEAAITVIGSGFPEPRVSGFTLNNCQVEYMEFGLTVKGSGWRISDNTFKYTGASGNSSRAVGIYGTHGNCFAVNNIFDSGIANDSSTKVFFYATGNGLQNTATYSGNVVVTGNSQASGVRMTQFWNHDTWPQSDTSLGTIYPVDSTPLSYWFQNNTTNETSAFVVLFSGTANFANILSQVNSSGNSISNTHGGANNGGKGVIAFDGSGAISYRSTALPVHVGSNTVSNATWRPDYALATGSSLYNVGYSTTNLAAITVSQDTSISTAPTIPTLPVKPAL